VVLQSHFPRPKLEGEQKRRRKAERIKRTRGNNSEATGAETDNATTLSVVEEARNTTSVGDNRTHSNGRSRKNEHGNGMTTAEDRVGAMQPLCNGSR